MNLTFHDTAAQEDYLFICYGSWWNDVCCNSTVLCRKTLESREFVHLRKWGTNILLTVDDYEWVYSLRPWEKSRMKMSSNSPVSYVCFKQEESLTISSAMTKDIALLWSDFFARARDLS